jgi:hypothetical protein
MWSFWDREKLITLTKKHEETDKINKKRNSTDNINKIT